MLARWRPDLKRARRRRRRASPRRPPAFLSKRGSGRVKMQTVAVAVCARLLRLFPTDLGPRGQVNPRERWGAVEPGGQGAGESDQSTGRGVSVREPASQSVSRCHFCQATTSFVQFPAGVCVMARVASSVVSVLRAVVSVMCWQVLDQYHCTFFEVDLKTATTLDFVYTLYVSELPLSFNCKLASSVWYTLI